MDGSDQWHTIYKTKLVIPSTQTDVLQQLQIIFVSVCCVKLWYIINWHKIGIELYTI
jgi:hypothetical protein